MNKAHLGQQQVLDELLRDGGAAAALAQRRDCASQAAYVVALVVEEPVVLGRHHRLRLLLPSVWPSPVSATVFPWCACA